MAEEVLRIAERHGVPLQQAYERVVEPEMIAELH